MSALPSRLRVGLKSATLVSVLLVNVAGKAGDALCPRLVNSRPLLLLALNANDTHLALTSSLPAVAAFAVSVPRRLFEDLLYFLAGERGILLYAMHLKEGCATVTAAPLLYVYLAIVTRRLDFWRACG